MKALGKKVSVLGLGISGCESALFLKESGFNLFVSDSGSSPLLRERAAILAQKGVAVEIGRHSEDRILSADWILISPGIPPASSIYQAALRKKIPVLSEIEMASRFCPSSQVIAVTGSSGKTTVATLLARVFERSKGRAIACGNIGTPWIAQIKNIKEGDFLVLEVSSFQLMHCFDFRPSVGVLLNLSANHQDWHRDMNEYVAAKLRLFQNQKPEDMAVIRRADQERFFPDFKFAGRQIYFDGPKAANPNKQVVRVVAGFFDCPPAMVEEVLRDFEGIEHRLEKVTVAEGVTYVNDSKGTTTAALAWALEKFSDHSVVLIAGGHPKSRDFETVRALVRRKVKKAVLIGEARPLLREAWQGEGPIFEAADFAGAVRCAKQAAASGDTVLLSPACASFDMFKNYEERGTLFKKIVRELTASQTGIHV